jgi:hypothetical protein
MFGEENSARHQLWQCHAEAEHVMAISLRSLAGELGA